MIAAFSYLVMAFVILLPLNNTTYTLTDTSPTSFKQTFAYRLLILLILLIPIGLSVYSINCMMVGKCVVWSYVQAVFIVLWVILFVVAALMASSAPSTPENQIVVPLL
jgi:hypothetical protein